MATINEITQGASYRGDPALGGAADFGVTISPSPLDRLATYTFYRDRDLWEKKKADDKDAAEKMAKLTALDPYSPFQQYYDDLNARRIDIRDFLRKRPSALYVDKDPEGYRLLQEKVGDFDVRRTHASANDLLWNSQKAAIEKDPNAESRANKLELLKLKGEDLFANGLDEAYRKQLEADADIKPQDYQVPTVPNAEKYSITEKPNEIYVEGFKYGSIPQLNAAADAVYLGLDRLDESSPGFKNLTDAQKNRRRLEAKISGSTRTKLDEQGAIATQMINEFLSQPGNSGKKATDIPDAELEKHPTIGGFIKLAKGYNEVVAKINAATGQQNQPMNLEDGLSGREIITLQTYAKNPEAFFSEIKPQIVTTNAEVEKGRLALDWAGLKWDKDKFAQTLKGAEQTKSAAVAFAENLFNNIGALASEKGPDGSLVLTPDDLRKMTADQLKWLGQELPPQRNEQGVVIQSAGINPLQLASNEILSLRPDGTIMVMKNAKLSPGGSKFEGEWDNKRSTTVQNIARLVLNEENARAGSKEINNYVPVDIGSREPVVNIETSGGSSSISASSSTRGGVNTGQPGKVYTVIDPQTGEVKGTVTNENSAEAFRKKGYTVK